MEYSKDEKVTVLISTDEEIDKMLEQISEKEGDFVRSNIQFLTGSLEELTSKIKTFFESDAGEVSEIDVVVLEVLSSQTALAEAQMIQEYGNQGETKRIKVYGCFFLQNEREGTFDADTYRALQCMEYNRVSEKPFYDNVVLISDDSINCRKQMMEALVNLSVCGEKQNSLQELFTDCSKAREEHITSKEVLVNGVIKSIVSPDDTYGYNGLGYAAACITGSSILSEIVEEVRQLLLTENTEDGWLQIQSKKINNEFLNQQVNFLFGNTDTDNFNAEALWNHALLEPIKSASVLGSNPVELSRWDINAGNTSAYEENFQIDEKVQQGIQFLENELQMLQQKILKREEKLLFQYGPNLIRIINSQVLPGIFEEGFKILKKQAHTIKRRPMQKIVGVTESEEVQRIQEWKYYYGLAVETEIRQKIARYFLEENIWEQLMLKPLERYSEICTFLEQQLNDTTDALVQQSEEQWVIDFGKHEKIAEWVKQKVVLEIRGKRLEELKSTLICELVKADKQSTSGTVTEIIANYVKSFINSTISLSEYFDTYAALYSEEEMQNMLHMFTQKYMAELLNKSMPLLQTNTAYLHIKRWVIVPQNLLNREWGHLLQKELSDFLQNDSNKPYVISGSEYGDQIACYQVSTANPLDEMEGMESFFKEVMDPCIEYALKEKIIERRLFLGEDKKYLYVANLISDDWNNFDLSFYKKKGQDGKLKKGHTLFEYLCDLNTSATDYQKQYQQEIIVKYDFSSIKAGADVDAVSGAYVKTMLRKNMQLFVKIHKTIEKYVQFAGILDRIPNDTEKKAEDFNDRNSSLGRVENVVPEQKRIRKFCRYCGCALKMENAKFCINCGRKLYD